MAGERGPTEGGADLRVPEADPSCDPCQQREELLRKAIEMVGQLQREVDQSDRERDQANRERDQGQQRISELEAQIEELKREQFGTKSEVQAKPAEDPPAKDPPPEPPPEPPVEAEPTPAESGEETPKPPTEKPKRRRGRQPGSPPPKRTPRPHVPTERERHELPAEERQCPQCGQPYRTAGCERSELYEIGIDVLRREIERVRYRPTCQCPEAREVSAPPVPRLLPRTNLGVSVWTVALVQVFAFFRTQAALLRDWRAHGLPIPTSTLSSGLRRQRQLFEDWIAALDAHIAAATVLHADETSWRVQQLGPDGHPPRHWLWVCVTRDAVRFRILPRRNAAAAQELLGAAARDGPTVVVCDRYSAYKALARACGGMLQLAFCWAHQRRDFRRVGTGFAGLQDWAESWLEAIGKLFFLAARRQEAWDPALETARQSGAYHAVQGDLESVVQGLFDRARDELAALQARYASTAGHARAEVDAQGKALHSLLEHEAGLSVFVQRPEVPPDNNAAERALRGAVIARYTSFGSGSADGAQLTERMYSIYATLKLAGLNPYRWTRDYLEACARNGRQPPADLGPWLPWRMDAARREELSLPPTAQPVALPAPADPSVASLARAA